MKTKKREEFLAELRRIPIVQVACEKVSLSRNTVYRWRTEDSEFRKAMEAALTEGESLVNDMSESQLLTLIKEKNWPALSFWLRHHHPKYSQKIELSGSLVLEDEPLTAEEEQFITQAIERSGIAKINPQSDQHGANTV